MAGRFKKWALNVLALAVVAVTIGLLVSPISKHRKQRKELSHKASLGGSDSGPLANTMTSHGETEVPTVAPTPSPTKGKGEYRRQQELTL